MGRVVVVLAAMGAVSCVPVLLPLPQPRSVHQVGVDESSLERLGRWDGGRFVPVSAASVPPSHLYVLVHGWAPGWRRVSAEHPNLHAWEAENGRGQPYDPWLGHLAQVIETADPYAVVLAYSWFDDAATARHPLAERTAWAHTDLHGRVMAEAITRAWRRDFFEGEGQMHLIGHSYGARVATLAALYLPKKPQQLTIFDAPEAPLTRITGSETRLAALLRKLPVGRGPGRMFVDNYVSMIGGYYHETPGLADVVDVALAPPYSALDYRHRHLYPMEFYARTAERSFGLGWSPLLARHAPPRPGCYQQPYGQLDVRRGCAGVP